MFLITNIVTAVVARLIIRRKQSVDLVTTLKDELKSERRTNARREAIHEHKLAVYRNAAIGQRTKELFEEAAAYSKPRLVVRR